MNKIGIIMNKKDTVTNRIGTYMNRKDIVENMMCTAVKVTRSVTTEYLRKKIFQFTTVRATTKTTSLRARAITKAARLLFKDVTAIDPT